jgi:hypothetical protein
VITNSLSDNLKFDDDHPIVFRQREDDELANYVVYPKYVIKTINGKRVPFTDSSSDPVNTNHVNDDTDFIGPQTLREFKGKDKLEMQSYSEDELRLNSPST